MSEDGSGAPVTGDAGQQPTETPATPPATPPDNNGADSRNGTTTDPWSAIATEFGDPDKVRKALEHARTWQTRAQQNFDAAQKVPTLQEQITQLERKIAANNERDATRSERTALAQLRGALGERGIKWDDLDEVLIPDAKRLLKDGEPNDEAIEKFAAALAKNAGRPTPDPDQGQRGGDAPTDMNALIRRAAGRA